MKLELRLGLRQVLAPQLIQSLKMLQMPVLKLEQTLRQELSTNPLLEELDIVEEDDAETPDDSDAPPETDISEPEEKQQDDQFDWEAYFEEGSEFVPRRIHEKPEDMPERTPVAEETLYDHLIEQLQLAKIPADELEIGEYIIGNINGDGLLPMSAEELAADLKVETAAVQKVLKLVQTFEPSGVGARDLRESLLIQMEQRGEADSLGARIVAEHWHELDRKTHMQLAHALGVSVERVQEAMVEMRVLTPRPAQGRFTTGARAVVPDLVVERVDDELVVLHNDKYVPRLRINAAYKSLIKRGGNAPAETKKYVREKLEQARWLLNALNQRRSTMIRVMEAIIGEQREFFDKGPAFLKPLIMEDIARIVDINVATVSRVANDKYVQTPQGVREIKYFFNCGVERTGGDAMTKTTVKQQIARIIDGENPAKPHSDQEIYRKLQEDGIKMARRTVTKYREELHIPAARFRKKVFDKGSRPTPVCKDPVEPAPEKSVHDGGEAADPGRAEERRPSASLSWTVTPST